MLVLTIGACASRSFLIVVVDTPYGNRRLKTSLERTRTQTLFRDVNYAGRASANVHRSSPLPLDASYRHVATSSCLPLVALASLPSG